MPPSSKRSSHAIRTHFAHLTTQYNVSLRASHRGPSPRSSLASSAAVASVKLFCVMDGV